jgi:hypothetical protein
MLTTGLLGGSTTTSASAIASSTPGAGVADSAPIATMADAGRRRAVPHPPLLEVDDPLPAVGAHPHVGLDPVVAHRQQRRARLPPGAQRRVTCDSG